MSREAAEGLQKALKIEDRLKRTLYVVGLWTRELESLGVCPIIVGGTAVEFYTLGAYATRDVDLVCPARDEALASLEALGFERTESLRHWYHEDLEVVVEIPDEVLAGDVDKISQVEVDGLKVFLIGIEDLVLDRVRAYVHWRSEADGEWAHRLMMLHHEEMDWAYLFDIADKEGIREVVERLDPRTS